MEYRTLGDTDLQVSILSLGTVALGMPYGIAPRDMEGGGENIGMTPPSDKEAIQLVHRALDAGINFIDTARAYGRSEEVLGQALQGQRDKVVITTKTGCYDADANVLRGQALRQHIEDSIMTSLRLLRTDYVDLLMLHSAPTQLLQNGEVVGILQEIKERGLTRYIGASTYGETAPQMALTQGVDALQVAYNILDQRMADAIFPLASSKGVGVVVRSVFLKGVLTPRANDLPEHLAELKQRSEAVKQFAAQLSPAMPRVEAALRFVLSHPNITSALVGVHSETELEASLRVAEATAFAPDIMARFERLRWDDPEMLNPSTWGLP